MPFHISQKCKGNFMYNITQNIDRSYSKFVNCFLIDTTSNGCCSVRTKLEIHYQPSRQLHVQSQL